MEGGEKRRREKETADEGEDVGMKGERGKRVERKRGSEDGDDNFRVS